MLNKNPSVSPQLKFTDEPTCTHLTLIVTIKYPTTYIPYPYIPRSQISQSRLAAVITVTTCFPPSRFISLYLLQSADIDKLQDVVAVNVADSSNTYCASRLQGQSSWQ